MTGESVWGGVGFTGGSVGGGTVGKGVGGGTGGSCV